MKCPSSDYFLILTFVSDPIKVIEDFFVPVATHSRLEVAFSGSKVLRCLTVDETDVVQPGILPVPLVVLHSLERYFEVGQSSDLNLTVIPFGAVISIHTPYFLLKRTWFEVTNQENK